MGKSAHQKTELSLQTEWYDFTQIKNILRKLIVLPLQIQIGFNLENISDFNDSHPSQEVQNFEQLVTALNFLNSATCQAGFYILPMNLHAITKRLQGQEGGGTGHWVGLYVEVKEGGSKEVSYLDPMGHAIDEEIKKLVEERLDINIDVGNIIKQPMRGIPLQYVKLINAGVLDDSAAYYEGNTNDCVPLLTYSILRLTCPSLPFIFPTHSQESIQIGQVIREALLISLETLKLKVKEFIESTEKHNDDRYLVSFDDSSDEEDEVESYDIRTSYNKANASIGAVQHEDSVVKVSPEVKLSFITHALGIKRLYSDSVQRKYYVLKNQYLKYQEEHLPSEENLAELFREALVITIKNALSFSGNSTAVAAGLFQNFQELYITELENIIGYLVDHKRELMRISAISHKSRFDESLSSCFEIIKLLLSEHITLAHVGDYFDGNNALKEIASTMADMMPQNKDGTLSVAATSLKKVKDSMLESSCSSPSIQKKVNEAYEYAESQLRARGTKSTALETFHDDLLGSLEEANTSYSLLVEGLEDAFLDTEFAETLRRGHSKFIREEVSMGRKTLRDTHKFDLSDETFACDFQAHFLATLRLCNRSQKREMKNHRDLDSQKYLDSEYKYYEEEGTSRAWKFPSSPHEAIDMHRLSTSATPLRDDRTESAGSYAVVNKKLAQLILLARKCKPAEAQDISDRDIAHWISQIKDGEKLESLTYYHDHSEINFIPLRLFHIIKRDLVHITYLIFGSEVMRNPAALIHNQMMLDLIKADEINWEGALYYYNRKKIGKEKWQTEVNEKEEVIEGAAKVKAKKKIAKKVEIKEEIEEMEEGAKKVEAKEEVKVEVESHGGLMPMSMKGAVDQARDLHSGYFQFMPHSYVYDSRSPVASVEVSELVQREYIITLYWLCMKMKKDAYLASYFVKDTTSTEHLKELLMVVCGQTPAGGLLTLRDDKIENVSQYIWNNLYPNEAIEAVDAEFARLGGAEALFELFD